MARRAQGRGPGNPNGAAWAGGAVRSGLPVSAYFTVNVIPIVSPVGTNLTSIW